jgi:hypothetical protein
LTGTIQMLEATKDIERVRPNPAFISERLKQVRLTLKTASEITADPASQLTLAYDAMRGALESLLNLDGYRVPNKPGGHRTTIAYARARFGDSVPEDFFDLMSGLKEVRHTIEYPNPEGAVPAGPSAADGKRACEMAQATIQLVTQEIKRSSQPKKPAAEGGPAAST